MSAHPIGVFSMTASEPLYVSVPNNACRALATIVTCTMHGFRHAPGSNHVCVSILGIIMFSFVICKYNLQSSDGTSQRRPRFALIVLSFVLIVLFFVLFLFCFFSVLLFLPVVLFLFRRLSLFRCSVFSVALFLFHCPVLYSRIASASSEPAAKVIIILQTQAKNANYY